MLPEYLVQGARFQPAAAHPPIGSGPYRIASFRLGRSVTFVRDPHWWARDLPTSIGTNNFNTVRIEYYREATVALEAFKAGDADLRAENISKTWATGYDFPAVRQGLVIKADIRHHLPTGMQGWAMNTRRAVFANPLTREAMAIALISSGRTSNLFYGQYTPHPQLFQQQRPRRDRPAGAGRAQAARSVPGRAAEGPVHPALHPAGHRRARR